MARWGRNPFLEGMKAAVVEAAATQPSIVQPRPPESLDDPFYTTPFANDRERIQAQALMSSRVADLTGGQAPVIQQQPPAVTAQQLRTNLAPIFPQQSDINSLDVRQLLGLAEIGARQGNQPLMPEPNRSTPYTLPEGVSSPTLQKPSENATYPGMPVQTPQQRFLEQNIEAPGQHPEILELARMQTMGETLEDGTPITDELIAEAARILNLPDTAPEKIEIRKAQEADQQAQVQGLIDRATAIQAELEQIRMQLPPSLAISANDPKAAEYQQMAERKKALEAELLGIINNPLIVESNSDTITQLAAAPTALGFEGFATLDKPRQAVVTMAGENAIDVANGRKPRHELIDWSPWGDTLNPSGFDEWYNNPENHPLIRNAEANGFTAGNGMHFEGGRAVWELYAETQMPGWVERGLTDMLYDPLNVPLFLSGGGKVTQTLGKLAGRSAVPGVARLAGPLEAAGTGMRFPQRIQDATIDAIIPAVVGVGKSMFPAEEIGGRLGAARGKIGGLFTDAPKTALEKMEADIEQAATSLARAQRQQPGLEDILPPTAPAAAVAPTSAVPTEAIPTEQPTIRATQQAAPEPTEKIELAPDPIVRQIMKVIGIPKDLAWTVKNSGRPFAETLLAAIRAHPERASDVNRIWGTLVKPHVQNYWGNAPINNIDDLFSHVDFTFSLRRMFGTWFPEYRIPDYLIGTYNANAKSFNIKKIVADIVFGSEAESQAARRELARPKVPWRYTDKTKIPYIEVRTRAMEARKAWLDLVQGNDAKPDINKPRTETGHLPEQVVETTPATPDDLAGARAVRWDDSLGKWVVWEPQTPPSAQVDEVVPEQAAPAPPPQAQPFDPLAALEGMRRPVDSSMQPTREMQFADWDRRVAAMSDDELTTFWQWMVKQQPNMPKNVSINEVIRTARREIERRGITPEQVATRQVATEQAQRQAQRQTVAQFWGRNFPEEPPAAAPQPKPEPTPPAPTGGQAAVPTAPAPEPTRVGQLTQGMKPGDKSIHDLWIANESEAYEVGMFMSLPRLREAIARSARAVASAQKTRESGKVLVSLSREAYRLEVERLRGFVRAAADRGFDVDEGVLSMLLKAQDELAAPSAPKNSLIDKVRAPREEVDLNTGEISTVSPVTGKTVPPEEPPAAAAVSPPEPPPTPPAPAGAAAQPVSAVETMITQLGPKGVKTGDRWIWIPAEIGTKDMLARNLRNLLKQMGYQSHGYADGTVYWPAGMPEPRRNPAAAAPPAPVAQAAPPPASTPVERIDQETGEILPETPTVEAALADMDLEDITPAAPPPPSREAELVNKVINDVVAKHADKGLRFLDGRTDAVWLPSSAGPDYYQMHRDAQFVFKGWAHRKYDDGTVLWRRGSPEPQRPGAATPTSAAPVEPGPIERPRSQVHPTNDPDPVERAGRLEQLGYGSEEADTVIKEQMIQGRMEGWPRNLNGYDLRDELRRVLRDAEDTKAAGDVQQYADRMIRLLHLTDEAVLRGKLLESDLRLIAGDTQDAIRAAAGDAGPYDEAIARVREAYRNPPPATEQTAAGLQNVMPGRPKVEWGRALTDFEGNPVATSRMGDEELDLELQGPPPEVQRQNELAAGQVDMFGAPPPSAAPTQPTAAAPQPTDAELRAWEALGGNADDFDRERLIEAERELGRREDGDLFDEPDWDEEPAGIADQSAVIADSVSRLDPAVVRTEQAAPSNITTATIDQLVLDTDRYQMRKAPYVRSGVDQVKANFDPQQLTPLQVARRADGTLEVLAGHNRRQAIRELVDEGRLPKDFAIPVQIMEGDASALRKMALKSNDVIAMTPTEIGGKIRSLMDEFGEDLDTARGAVKRSDAEKYINLTYLSQTMQGLVDQFPSRYLDSFAVMGDYVRRGISDAAEMEQVFDVARAQGGFDEKAIARALEIMEEMAGPQVEQLGLFAGMDIGKGNFGRALEIVKDLQSQRSALNGLLQRTKSIADPNNPLNMQHGVALADPDAVARIELAIAEIDRKLTTNAKEWFTGEIRASNVLDEFADPSDDAIGFLPDSVARARRATQDARIAALEAKVASQPVPYAGRPVIISDWARSVFRRQFTNDELAGMTWGERLEDLLGKTIGESTDEELRDALVRFSFDLKLEMGYKDAQGFGRLLDRGSRAVSSLILLPFWALPKQLIGNTMLGNTMQQAVAGQFRALAHGWDVRNWKAFIRQARTGAMASDAPAVRQLAAWGLGPNPRDYRGFTMEAVGSASGGINQGKSAEKLAQGARPGLRGLPAKAGAGIRKWTGIDFGRELMNGLEWSYRVGAGTEHMRYYLAKNFDRFIDGAMATARKMAPNLPEPELQTLLRHRGFKTLNAQQLYTDMQRLAKANGLSTTQARAFADRVARDWANLLHDAENDALKKVHKSLFSYEAKNIDVYLRRVMPFHMYLTRAYPFYAEQMIRHPGFAAAYYRAHEGMERYAEENNWPAGLRGFVKIMSGPMGLAMFGKPIVMSAMLDIFVDVNGGYTPENVTGIGRALNSLQRVGFGPLPYWGALLNYSGYLGSSAIHLDPVGTFSARKVFGSAIQMLAANGWLGDDWQRYLGKPFEDRLARIREYTSGWLPGSKNIPATDQGAVGAEIVRNLMLTAALEDRGLDDAEFRQMGMAPEGSVERDTYDTVMEEVLAQWEQQDGEYFDTALQAYANFEGIQGNIARAFLTGPKSIRSEDQMARQAAVAQNFDDQPPDGFSWWPETDPLMGPDDIVGANETRFLQEWKTVYGEDYEAGDLDRLRAVEQQMRDVSRLTPEGAALMIADSQRDVMGDPDDRKLLGTWNHLAFGDMSGEALTPTSTKVYQVGGRTYFTYQIEQMTQDERFALADAWLTEHDKDGSAAALREQRDVFDKAHPEYALYEAWQKEVRKAWEDYGKDAMRMYRAELIRTNPNAKRYFNDQIQRIRKELGPDATVSQINRELDKITLSPEAYQAIKGVKTYQNAPRPLDAGADPRPPGAGGGSGDGSGSGSSSDYVAWEERVPAAITEAEADLREVNQILSQASGGQPVDYTLLPPPVREWADQMLANAGFEFSDDYWIYEKYVDWAWDELRHGRQPSISLFIMATKKPEGETDLPSPAELSERQAA